jgi:hypothetical protein
MDYLSSANRYAYLSLADLLIAREQFHAHFVHKRHCHRHRGPCTRPGLRGQAFVFRSKLNY